ncbi:MAG: MFS transporter [Myxococcota bacterium]
MACVTLGPLAGRRTTTSERVLSSRVKVGFALGDHTVNAALSALSLFYLFFLTQVSGLRPALAGAVLLTGRAVDAFTDPAMGRLSDRTGWRLGRRRPYFLLGALPFGFSFALLWQAVPLEGQLERFAVYAAAYALHSVASTVLAVPYMALLPELAVDYHERTSLNTFRSAAAVLGTLLAAVGFRPLVEAFGGGAPGFAAAGTAASVWLVLPWLVVYSVTWERPRFAGQADSGLADGLRRLVAHRAYRQLVALYLCARIAVDLIGAMLLFYFQHWLRRPGDFSIAIALLLCTVVASLPIWLRIARAVEKRTIFIFGACWWIGAQAFLLVLEPNWPRWTMFAVAAAAGIGYAVADLMPWSMLGEVIDEDELETGQRREGVYAGLFTFVRKLGGASGVALAGVVLDLSGFTAGSEPGEGALLAIRALTGGAPALFLALAAVIALSYPLTRVRHDAIVSGLRSRRGSG